MVYTALQSYQVLQRDADDKAQVRLANGEIKELTVGGPYVVDDAHDVLVGDLWVLAGQSNMQGIGDLIQVEEPSPFVHSLQSREEWAVAEEPLHWLEESPRIVHHQLLGANAVPNPLPEHDPTRTKGAGLGLSFAKERYARTGIPIGLIPCAHGGTSMEQWNPDLLDRGDASLYGAMLKRIERIGGKVAGVLWYQGESDAIPESIEQYPRRMDGFLEALRRDLERPDLPFYYVQISRVVTSDANAEDWNSIREAQRTWAATQTHVTVVSSIDLELDDLIHVGTQGLKRLGRRLADAVDGLSAPDILAVHVDTSSACIRVIYRNVRGGLSAPGRPAGFSLRDSQGSDLPILYKVTLEGQSVVLHLSTDQLPPGTALWYGWGLDPYCNVTDAADAALLALGPLVLV